MDKILRRFVVYLSVTKALVPREIHHLATQLNGLCGFVTVSGLLRHGVVVSGRRHYHMVW